ncbi:hypothetical protein SAMN04488168_10764 [Bacillus sp. 491mf]|uniref:hypothetical protein n=1 Tax=Bacillus TaxID=1386 RepID=UPI00055435E4|nr:MULTISPECIES: hypothetical protein [unclassified Bacillus (in: firmicutes)]SFC64283.1 hypothetical protein SAMN04488168_10764 [Bacillus sp. 491mf]
MKKGISTAIKLIDIPFSFFEQGEMRNKEKHYVEEKGAEFVKKRMMCFLAIMLISLSACGKEKEKQEKVVPTSQEAAVVTFQGKEVKEIQLTSTKTKGTKVLKKADDIKQLVSAMEQVGLEENGDEPKTLSLDKEAKSAIHYNMSIDYSDGSIGKYFVWIEDDGEVVIGHKDTPEKERVEFYDLKEASKKVAETFKIE